MKCQLVLVPAIALAFACLCRAQDLTKPINYRTVAISLHTALDEISKQSGIRLGATDELANEPIILSVKGATTRDTMDHIAAAIGAEWQKKADNEYLLNRTGEIEEKLEKQTLDLREANIKKAIDRLVKELNDGESPGAHAQKTAQALAASLKMIDENRGTESYNQLATRYPGHRALVQLIATLTPRQIAEIGSGQKIVYSTRPNPMQVQLPDAANAVIDEFEEDQNRFSEAFAKAHPGPIQGDLSKRVGKLVEHVSKPPAKLLLIIRGTAFLQGFPTVTFVAVADDGQAVGDAQEELTLEPLQGAWKKSVAVLSAASKDPEIPLSAESHDFSNACEAVLHKVGDPPALSASQQDLLVNTDQHDPLSFLASDGFLALADKTNGNLVAWPSDSLVYLNFQEAEDKSFKLATFLNVVQQSGMDIETDGDWTTAIPLDPVDAVKARTDRVLLANCLREAAAQGTISIETAAKLALSEDEFRQADLPWSYSLFGNKYSPFYERSEKLLRFYESLSDSQIGALQGGGVLRAGELTKDQWQLLEALAYGRGMYLASGPVDEYGDLGDYIMKQEPTELLPNGLPGDATVSMKSANEDVLFAGFQLGTNIYASKTTLDAIADTIASRQAGIHSDFEEDVEWISGGHSRSLDFEFVLTPSLKGTGSLREVTRSSERWKMDALPSDLKARLDAAIVAARARIDKTSQEPQPQPTATPPDR